MLFSWDFLIQGFATALSPMNLLWAAIGCLLGTLIGVLPGIGPAAGIAILMPVTTKLSHSRDHHDGGDLLRGHVRRVYDSNSRRHSRRVGLVPTVLDGYEMAKQGRAGAALGIAAISSLSLARSALWV